MLTRVVGRLPSARGVAVARTLSTSVTEASASAPASDADGSYSYVMARREYNAEIASLRKVFMGEVARRKEKLARDAE